MSVIEKLNATDLKLSKSDRRLLDYIRENGLNACSAPISEIARSCDASLVKNGDLVIAFSNSGETREILKACETAKMNHASIIAITADANSSLHKLSEMSLVYAVRESYMETGSINSKIAVFFIVDLLFTEVVKRLGKDAYSTKQKTALALKKTEGTDFPNFSHKF